MNSGQEYVQRILPNCSGPRISLALHKAGGNSEAAIDILLNEKVPDIKSDLREWYSFFDLDNNGLSEDEVLDALKQTFGGDLHIESVRESVHGMWPLFDHDNSGTISFEEFIQPGGLGETIVAQIPALSRSEAPPILSTFDSAASEIHAIFPDMTLAVIEGAVRSANGNKEAAIENLLNPTQPMSPPTQAVNPGPPPYQGVAALYAASQPPVSQPPANQPAGPPPAFSPSYVSPTGHATMPPPPPVASGYNSYLSQPPAPVAPGYNSYISQPPAPPVEPPAVPSSYRCGVCQASFAVRPPTNSTSSTFDVSCPQCKQVNRIVIASAPVASLPQATAVPAVGFTSHQYNATSSSPATSNSTTATATTHTHFRPNANIPCQPAPPLTINCTHAPGKVHVKRALLVGINYTGHKGQLRGCVNDVYNMFRLLTETYGWSPSCISILTDDPARSHPSAPPANAPTKANILTGLKWLTADVSSGDAIFFHFSGHGGQSPDAAGVEEDGMNETILPVDVKKAGMITDDEINRILVQTLPQGVRVTALMDSCHSGTGLDLPYEWHSRRMAFVEETNPYHSLGDVQLFSGCEDAGTSSDAASLYCAPGGAMTTAYCEALRLNPCPTYVQLLHDIQTQLRQRGFKQKPQLSSSQRFDVNRHFLLDDAVANSNQTIGRTMRKRFKAQRRRRYDNNMNDMMGIGAAVVGGMILADIIF